MIKILRHALLVLLFVYSCVSLADEETKVVLHINDSFKLTHLQNSVKNIRAELGGDVKIKIIINGKVVQGLLKNNEVNTKIVNFILKKNVDIGLCHNALRNNSVSSEMLIEGLDVLPTDGNVTIIKLQQQGYIYIKL